MKTKLLILISALFCLLSSPAQKYKMVLHFTNGMVQEYHVDALDSISWIEDTTTPDDDDDYDQTEATVTGEAKEVNIYSATVSACAGYAVGKEDSNISAGIIYCSNGIPAKGSGIEIPVSLSELDANGAYDVNITELAPSTTYRYRSYITFGETCLYGKIESFTTASQGITFSTGTASAITCYSASVAAQININEAAEYETLSYGVCYSTNPIPTIDDRKTECTIKDEDGNYSALLTALQGDSIYFYRPYAVMNGFVSYGMVGNFQTSSDNLTETGEINASDYSIVSTLNIPSATFNQLTVGVCYARTEVPTVDDFTVTSSNVDEDGHYTTTLPLTVDTWYYRSYALVDGVAHYGDTKEFVVESSDTRESVDLGLSVKWATCNVGASLPTDDGDYFAWAASSGYNDGQTNFNWANYTYTNGGYNQLTKYCTDETYGKKDNLTTMQEEDDAAFINWGAKWRVPTEKEFAELREKCSWRWYAKDNIKYDGTAGYEVTGTNGNSIFLPAAGYRYNGSLRSASTHGRYWTNAINPETPNNARCFDFSSGEVNDKYRYYGFSLRPVCTE